MSDDGPSLHPDPQERPLTLRCLGLRITTNDRQHAPVDAQVWDGERVLAGPFPMLEEAVAWIKARRPSPPQVRTERSRRN
ncbi:MAG TPA: hypothetical protein VHY82_02390 [Acetobacteraceae bacterium]|jgi:hypothetical protein|nr:hypothetical protein [Acetobacteraceae bacterium]